MEREAKSESQNWSEFSHYYKEWLMRTNPDLTADPMAQYESKKGEVKSGVVEAVQRRHSAQCVHSTVFFPLDRARSDLS